MGTFHSFPGLEVDLSDWLLDWDEYQQKRKRKKKKVTHRHEHELMIIILRIAAMPVSVISVLAIWAAFCLFCLHVVLGAIRIPLHAS